jgi:hypothetical protein
MVNLRFIFNSSMSRREQFADLDRIDNLAMKASGEVAVAAILAAKHEGLGTVTAAVELAMKRPDIAQQMVLKAEYRITSISNAISKIREKAISVDYKKIGTFDAAGQSTKKIFEGVIAKINDDLTEVYKNISEIFIRDAEYNLYAAETLDQIKNIKLIADQIQKLTWRITHSYFYFFVSRRLIICLLAAFLFAIPIWYFFGAHEVPIATLPEQGPALVQKDLRQLTEILTAQNTGIFVKFSSIASFAWNTLLVGPSLFLAPAALLGFVRRRRFFRSNSLRRYEELFGGIGKELRKIAPNPSSWLTVRIKMSNFNFVTGNNNIVNSTVTNAFNQIKDVYDPSTEAFLKEVGEVVTKSADPNAAQHYEVLADSLKNDKKGMARTMWDGLVKILPSVGAIAGAAGAIAKLFGP